MSVAQSSATVQQNPRALLRRFVDDVINAQDLDGALLEIVAENFVELNPLPGQGPGRAGLADVLAMMFAGFPDLRWTVHDTLVEGDRVMGLFTWTGTHESEFMGIPATGHTATSRPGPSTASATASSSRAILMDLAGLLGQLGGLPAPQST